MADFLQIATSLVERLFSVIPLEPKGKRPLAGFGVTKRTQDLGLMTKWSETVVPADANVGICADEQFVILETDDFDRLRAVVLNGTGQAIPQTLMACGSSENRPHLFFKRTEKATNVGNLVVPGLFEARFNNQYVVGPGSVHPSGATYRWLNDCPVVPIPDWLVSELARLTVSQKSSTPDARRVETVGGRVPEGSRHYFLMRELGRLWNGKLSEEELTAKAFELNALCEPPKDEAHVRQCVRDIMRRDPYEPGPAVVIGTASKEVLRPESYKTAKHSYIIPRRDGKSFGNWFPRGTVSLAAGASGMGKTVLMCHLAENLRLGNPVFNHAPVKAEYGFVLVDRTVKELRESVEDKEMATEEIIRRAAELDILRPEDPAYQVSCVLKEWEAAGHRPDLVILEGADLWCGESSGVKETARFIKPLNQLATLWNIAIIASVGSPKQKPKEQYAMTRDKVYGSIAWGRMCSTILHISLTQPEDPDSIRKVLVLPRTGKSEVTYFEFQDGRLVFSDKPPEREEPAGVKETRILNQDKEAEIIAVIEKLTPGTELPLHQFRHWGSSTTISRYFTDLSHPLTGWVEHNTKGKWVVRDRHNQGEKK